MTWNAWDAEMKGWGAGKREQEKVVKRAVMNKRRYGKSSSRLSDTGTLFTLLWFSFYCTSWEKDRTPHGVSPVWSRGSFHWCISNPACLAIHHEAHKPDWEVNLTPGSTKMKRTEIRQSSGVSVHADTHALAPHKASDHLMKPLSFRNGMEVDALH